MGTGLRADLIVSAGSETIRELAAKAEELTDGRVAYAYATTPSTTTYWVFNPGANRMTKSEVITWLGAVIADPDKWRQ